MNMSKSYVAIGALLNAIAVVLGAFGAHYFKSILSPAHLAIYDTAIRYLFMHATGIILVGIISKSFNHAYLKHVFRLFIIGIILFSGSLFLLVATKISFFGAVTPLGGLSFIAGWLLLALLSLGIH